MSILKNKLNTVASRLPIPVKLDQLRLRDNYPVVSFGKKDTPYGHALTAVLQDGSRIVQVFLPKRVTMTDDDVAAYVPLSIGFIFKGKIDKTFHGSFVWEGANPLHKVKSITRQLNRQLDRPIVISIGTLDGGVEYSIISFSLENTKFGPTLAAVLHDIEGEQLIRVYLPKRIANAITPEDISVYKEESLNLVFNGNVNGTFDVSFC